MSDLPSYIFTKLFKKRISCIAFCFLVVTTASIADAAGQQVVKVVSETGAPLEDALVAYKQAGQKNFSKVALTDAKGELTLQDSPYPICIHISKLGYLPVIDTLKPNETKTYKLKESNVNLKDVVITGQFEPTTVDKSVNTIKVIDRKRIEQQGAVNLRDLLTNELNIRIAQDGILGSQMSIMGMGGQNVKILIDGVPVIGRNDGTIDISQINMNNIERVELIEGPMSVIYGTDALGGVINLITKKPTTKEYNINVNGYYESVGRYNTDLNLGYKYKQWQIAASGGRNFFDGYSEHEDETTRVKQWKPVEQYFGDFQVKYKFKTQSHRIYAQVFDEKVTNKGAPTITPYSISGSDDYYKTFRWSTSLYSDFYFNNKATLNLINSYSYYNRKKNTYRKDLVTGDQVLSADDGLQDTTTFDLVLTRGTYTTKNTSIFNSQFGYDINIERGTGKKLENGEQSIQDYAGFYIAEIKPVSRLVLKPGVRFIYNSRYGAPVVPSFNLKYDLRSDLVLRASYARGFRAPSLKELNLFFLDGNSHDITGNPNLKAERSNNFSLSLAFTKKYKDLQYTLEGLSFYNDIRDMISLVVTDTSTIPPKYSYANIDTYKTFGGNINATVKYKNLGITGGFSRTGRYNQLSETADVAPFMYSNEYRLNTTYRLPKPKIDFSVFYKYNGALPGFAVGADGETYQTLVGAYSMMDASVTKSFFKNNIVQLTVGAKNLLDVTTIPYTAQASTHSSPSSNMPTAMGRFFFTSIRFTIGKI